jgi:putative ABC transport system substrate-binding protein
MPFDHLKRRDLITLLFGAAAWPVAARAQQPLPVIGVLTNASFQGYEERLRRFRQGLAEAGYVESRNVTIELHEAGGDERRLSALVNELVRRRVNMIVTNGIATQAAKAATSTIPILFVTGADPVEMGVVASLNRPGANLTGVTALGDSLGPKRLELLHEIAPAVTDVGALFNPGNGSNEIQLRDLTMAARTLGLQLHVVNASGEQDFEIAFATLAKVNRYGEFLLAAEVKPRAPRKVTQTESWGIFGYEDRGQDGCSETRGILVSDDAGFPTDIQEGNHRPALRMRPERRAHFGVWPDGKNIAPITVLF